MRQADYGRVSWFISWLKSLSHQMTEQSLLTNPLNDQLIRPSPDWKAYITVFYCLANALVSAIWNHLNILTKIILFINNFLFKYSFKTMHYVTFKYFGILTQDFQFWHICLCNSRKILLTDSLNVIKWNYFWLFGYFLGYWPIQRSSKYGWIWSVN